MQAQEVTPEFFIRPGANLVSGTPDYVLAAKLSKEKLVNRWDTTTGQNILQRWRASKFDRSEIENLIGKFYDRIDLRGIPLAEEDLSGRDLRMVDLYGASLAKASFQYADLTDSYLSETDIRGTNFEGAKLTGVFFDRARSDKRTNFNGVNLSTINFTLATDLQNQAQSQQRIASLKRNHPLLAKFLELTCDYGRSFSRFLAWCAGVIFVFAFFYTIVPGALSESDFGSSLYFSVTTFTGFGGSIQPVSALGRIFVSIEAAIGYLMTGLLVSILVKRTIGD